MPASTTTPHPTTSDYSVTMQDMGKEATSNTRLVYIHEGANINKIQEIYHSGFGADTTSACVRFNKNNVTYVFPPGY